MKIKGHQVTLGDLARGVRRKAVDLLGLDLLSEAFAVLTLNYVFVMSYYTLELVFVNTLIFRVTGDMYSVFFYRGITYAACALGMNLCSAFARHISPTQAMKIAGGMYITMYLVMFIWLERFDVAMYPVACLAGLAMGLYWSGHNVLLTLYSTPRNRAVGIGITGIISGVMNLAVPLISGFVIQLMPEMTGYRVMFGLAVLVIGVHFIYLRRLTPVERRHKPRDYRFALRLVTRKLTLKVMLGFEFTRGMREGAFTFFLNMVLFQIITDESLVGFNSFLTGVLSILAAWVFGKLFTPENRIRYSLAAVTLLSLFCALLLLKINTPIVLIFGIFNTFLAFFLNNTATAVTFDSMGQNETLRGVMTELMGFREVALDGGRISGLIVVTLFPKNLGGYVWAMLTLTALQFVTVGLMAYAKSIQDRKQRKAAQEALP